MTLSDATCRFPPSEAPCWHDPNGLGTTHAAKASSQNTSKHPTHTHRLQNGRSDRNNLSVFWLVWEESLDYQWVHRDVSLQRAVILIPCNGRVVFRHAVAKKMPTSVVQQAWPSENERQSVAAECVLLRGDLCVGEPKTSSGCCTSYLPDRGNHRRATAKPPKPIKMLWSGVPFIYLFIPAGGEQPDSYCNYTLLLLLLLHVGNVWVEVPLRPGWRGRPNLQIFYHRRQGVWAWLPQIRRQSAAVGKGRTTAGGSTYATPIVQWRQS